MENLSVNGKLIPKSALDITDQYTGHFLKVSYSREILGHTVFSKDRVESDEEGNFRFFVPKKELTVNEMFTLEVYSPDGEMLGRQVYSHGALNASNIPLGAEDTSKKLEISVDPKVIVFNASSPVEKATRKINGKVIDISGEGKVVGLTVIIMVSDDSEEEYDRTSLTPIFTAVTDANGYFFGTITNKSTQQAFGIIAGNETNPILINLEKNYIPKNILLVSDLSSLADDKDCGCNLKVPGLPDSNDLVNSSAFSQDIGGSCVDFTVPNRTLEEFSFYNTVRTTEPEIKGLTINAKEGKAIKNELFDISNNIFRIVGRLNNSFSSLSLIPYTIEQDDQSNESDYLYNRGATDNYSAPKNLIKAFPNYMLKMNTGINSKFQISTNDLIAVNRGLNRSDIIKLAVEQQKREKKLKNLHQKLAAAYCGKTGVQEAKTYCEQLAFKDNLNREEIKALIGHLENNQVALEMNAETQQAYNTVIFELRLLLEKDSVDSKSLDVMGSKTEKLLHRIEKFAYDSSTKEIVIGYLQRIIKELARAEADSDLGFELCAPEAKADTMGIMCLIQKFKELKETLRNTAIFSLGEILEIRSYYTIFLESITSFLTLLEEFHTFYTTGLNITVELVDDYFYQNYDEIKSTLTALTRQVYLAIRRVEEIERAYIQNHPGRVNLSVENSIDWDEIPTIYENTTIANGHILHFKQVWKADGYSLGDLLYSLPLAPCQEKQIAIIDWDRKETGARIEGQVVSEQIDAQISRDRDITEIMSSSFGESINASSTNKTSSTSAGIGGGVGGFLSGVVFGVAGGISHSGASSKSTATQNSSRNLSANSLNSLQDSTSQSASSLRSQRNTVIQTVGQNESVNVQTEVIKNNNHCHAMTVEYFEVLKHYAIEQELVDVQECLFVPMPMSHFDHNKVLRWKNTLRQTIYGSQLIKGFDAIERIESNYSNSDLPIGTYANEVIEEFTGHFTISFELERPFVKVIDDATKTEEYDLSIPFPWFTGRLVFHLDREVPLTKAEKDAIFEEQYAADIVRGFIDQMVFYAIADDGTEQEIDLDVTLLSNYKKGSHLKVSIASNSLQNITRNQIKHLRFRANTFVKPASKIILRSAYLHYRTKHLSEYIVRNDRVNNDIINKVEFETFGVLKISTDAALLYTPLNRRELSNPRKEDQEAAAALVSFLNEYMEMSHKIIWSSMDASRLFGLLDGFLAPNSGGRSVASVVENKIIGIVGNNLVLKVIPGERLDPVFKNIEDLLEYYQPTSKLDPYRISVPTKGVYAESVMGKCNSCEEIDDTRHWRFSDEPCGSKPTEIEAVSTASRRTDPGNLQVKDLPTNIINMQSAPSAPDPTGLAAAYGLLGKGDSFNDFTGLTGTQANALGALQTTSKSVTDLASISKDFANLAVMANQKKDGAKQIEQIKKLNREGYLTSEEANGQIKKVLDTYTDASDSVVGKNSDPDSTSLTNSPEIKKAISKASDSGSGSVNLSRTTRDGSETVSVQNDSKSDSSRIIENPDLNAYARSFNPATIAAPSGGSKSGTTTFSVRVSNMPAGGSLRWTVPASNSGDFTFEDGSDVAKGDTVTILGIRPSLSNIDVEVRDASNNIVQSLKLPLSIPQFVTIAEDKVEFEKVLEDLSLLNLKNDIVKMAKQTCDTLLVGANVRTIWQLGTFSEVVPAHLPPDMITTAVFRNIDPARKSLMGVTFSAPGESGNITPNRTISIYPGSYSEPLEGGELKLNELDTETQALILQLKSQDMDSDPLLEEFATKVYGRLLGETLAHEIIHALLWDIILEEGHNEPLITNDIMNPGTYRHFTQRTGFVDNSFTSPVIPSNFTDNGIKSIGGLKALNQSRMDKYFPTPGARTSSFD